MSIQQITPGWKYKKSINRQHLKFIADSRNIRDDTASGEILSAYTVKKGIVRDPNRNLESEQLVKSGSKSFSNKLDERRNKRG